MERYYLTRSPAASDGYALEVHELDTADPALIPQLIDLDLLTFAEPTFSRFTLGAILRFGRIFTVTADELIIGVCYCLRDWERPDEVVIFNMALRPGWRGHGLGTRFLHKVLVRLKQGGATAVTLSVAASNQRAIAVYRTKFGFDHVSTLRNEYNTGQEYLLMRLDLTREIGAAPPATG